VDVRLTGEGQDAVRFDSKLIVKMGYLAGGIATADFRPTLQHGEVQQLLGVQLTQHLAALDAVMRAELVPLNQQLKAKGLPEVVDRGRTPVQIVP